MYLDEIYRINFTASGARYIWCISGQYVIIKETAGSSGGLYGDLLSSSLKKALQGKSPCRTGQMVIGGVCLPVRFAGSKQGAEEIKEQTRMNNISVQSADSRDQSSADLIIILSLPFILITFLYQCYICKVAPPIDVNIIRECKSEF